MKLLITGGMGFIGTNFIRYIYNKYPGYQIVNFDALTYAGNPDNLADFEQAEIERPERSRRYSFVKSDIADVIAVKSAIEKYQPDAIINFAAESHVDRSLVDCAEFIRSNVVGVQNLLEFSRKQNIKFLQISTDEIYGDVAVGVSDEGSCMNPNNPYAASKAAADLLVQSYWRTHKAPVLTVRGSNNFGPYQYPEKLIPLAITNMFAKERVPVHGNGAHVRTWLHVDDFVSGIDLVLHNASFGSIYNIAGHENTNLNVLACIAKHFGFSPTEILEYVGDRPGADMRYAPSAEKISRELGWKPKRHLDEALPDLVNWYAKNEQWWKKLKEKSEFTDHYEKQKHAKYD